MTTNTDKTRQEADYQKNHANNESERGNTWRHFEDQQNTYQPETYEVIVVCGNCNQPPTKIQIRKGIRLQEKECPNCGCTTLRLFI